MGMVIFMMVRERQDAAHAPAMMIGTYAAGLPTVLRLALLTCVFGTYRACWRTSGKMVSCR